MRQFSLACHFNSVNECTVATRRADRLHTYIFCVILLTSAIKRLVTVNVFEVMAINLNTDTICTYSKFVQQVT
jgi:hypothetical protein